MSDKGFDGNEVDQITELVDYFEVKEGQTLLKAGQQWPYVVFILRGAVSYDAYNHIVRTLEKDADGHVQQILRVVGTVALFGDSLLSDSSRVSMAEDGTLAGLTFEQVKDLSEEGGLSTSSSIYSANRRYS